MKTILITAYAINPYKGSEDGTGWNITKEIAKKFKVILITRKNNVPHLDKFFAENEDDTLDNIQYFGFDLSESVMKLKKKTGPKNHVIYYYLSILVHSKRNVWFFEVLFYIRALSEK